MKRFFNWIKTKRSPASSDTDRVKVLLKKIASTEPEEISCDDVGELLAAFAERRSQGEDVSRLMPQVEKHLELCPACREDYEALLLAIEAENKLTA